MEVVNVQLATKKPSFVAGMRYADGKFSSEFFSNPLFVEGVLYALRDRPDDPLWILLGGMWRNGSLALPHGCILENQLFWEAAVPQEVPDGDNLSVLYDLANKKHLREIRGDGRHPHVSRPDGQGVDEFLCRLALGRRYPKYLKARA